MVASLTPEQAEAELYNWRNWARPNQLEPEEAYSIWLILAGRGYGKSRAGAEWIKQKVYEGHDRIALVGATAADVRDVMIEGESGLLNVFPPSQRPEYQPSKRRVIFRNGCVAYTYSAEEPNRLRGPQHSVAWGDEIAAWKYPDTFDQLMFTLRLGNAPKAMFTTTPRPTELIKKLTKRQGCIVTTGSSYENRENLAADWFEQNIAQYEGTRLGRQEIYAEILDDVEGALWTLAQIESLRGNERSEYKRKAVAVDPAISANEKSDETGIVVGGVTDDDFMQADILADCSLIGSPDEWAKAAVLAYHQHECDYVVAEVNQGGDMVERMIHNIDPQIRVKQVRATRGKYVRAEPVSMLYEQGRVRHCGVFKHLEDQMTQWSPVHDKDSPDRLDALVWLLTELMLEKEASPRLRRI